MLYTTFTVKDKEYKARLNAKACVDLEKKLGTNPLNVVVEIANQKTLPELNKMLLILHASLTTYNHGITLDKVYSIYDDFVDEGKTLVDLIPIVLEIFKVSGFFPEDAADEEDEEKN